MSEDEGSSWTERLERAVRDALGDLGHADGETGVLERALEQWLDGQSLRAFVSGAGRDQVATPGSQVTLTVRLTRIARLRAERVRVFVGGEQIGEVSVGRSDILSLPFGCSSEPGLYEVEFEPVDADGVAGRRAATAKLAVFEPERPLAAIDAAGLVEDVLDMVEACRRLAQDGWGLVYLDLAEAPRNDEIREAIRRYGLPDGVVLEHPLDPGDFDTLGVDFRPAFLANRLRTMRAGGLALVLLVTEGGGPWDLVEQESLQALGPSEVNEQASTMAGRAALREPARSLIERRSSCASDVEARLDAMTRSSVRAGNRFAVELDNRRARERLLEVIRGAERTLHLQFYIFEAGRFAEALVQALAERARAGVSVRLVVDALYSREDLLGLANEALDTLRIEPGVQVLASDPIPEADLIEPLALRQRDHRKLVVVDGRLGFVSGRNAGDAYYFGFDEVEVGAGTPHDAVPWFDAHVEVEGPLVADIEAAFAANWARNGGVALPELTMPAPAGDSSGRLVVHDGVQDADGLGAYVALLDGAREHVYVVNDFPVVHTVADAVERALARGVRVVFLTGSAVPRNVQGDLLDGPLHRVLFEYMTKSRLEPLLVAGAEGYELCTPPLPNVSLPKSVYRPYVHAKVVSVDGRAASIGSANLDVTASYWEREANVIIECPKVVGALEAELEGWRARAHRLELDTPYWRREAMQRDLTARLWWDLLYPV